MSAEPTLPLSLDQIQRVQRGEPVEVEVAVEPQPPKRWRVAASVHLNYFPGTMIETPPGYRQTTVSKPFDSREAAESMRAGWAAAVTPGWDIVVEECIGNDVACPYPVGARVGVLEAWQNNFSLHLSHGGYLFESSAATDQSWHGNWARQLPDGTWVDHYGRPFVWRSAASMPLWAIRTHVLVTQSDARVVDGRAVWVVTIVGESGVARG